MKRLGSGAIVGGVLAAVLVVGCSAARRRQVIQFFFDSPPQTTASAPADDRPPSQVSQPVPRSVAKTHAFASIHPSFERRRCWNCHDPGANQMIVTDFTRKCSGCHPRIFEPRGFIHGPAGSFACNQCHLPHASALPKLLRQGEPGLCLACHSPTLSKDVRYHGDQTIACTRCHESHSGDDPRMLKPIEQWRDLVPNYTPTTRRAAAGGRS